MTLRAPLLTLALALAGCGDTASHDTDLAATTDLARASDLAPPRDLAPPPDLGPPPDLAPPPDLLRPIDDLATPPPPDDGGLPPPPPRCPANIGYVGVNGECGIAGMCNGQNFALDCDTMVCVCSIDGKQLKGWAQDANSCQTLMQDWSQECGF